MGKLIDMIGYECGRLKVIARAPTKNGTTARWLCQCECGNLKEIDGTKLRRQEVLSCGCLQKEKVLALNKEKLIDLTGKTFGKLTVLKRGENIGLQPSWICQCECGTITQVMGGNLRKDNGTRSCGCEISKGELDIKLLLSNNNIKYISQYTFDDCVSETGAKLRFDFCIFQDDNKTISHLIEFQGRQHYEETNFFKNNLQEQKTLDGIKRKYCKNNNIPLLIVPYWEQNNITIKDLLLNSRFQEEMKNEESFDYC